MIKKAYLRVVDIWGNSLYRNSFWLMAGSFSMAGIGFIYWIFASRIYSPTQIGLATTFLSGISLVNSLSMLGFNQTLIRYLPVSTTKAKQVNTAFTVVCFASLVLGAIYLLTLPFFTDKLGFVRSSASIVLLILAFMPINTLNGITDSVFTAHRQTHWVFLSNILQSIAKLLFLVVLSSYGPWGIIGSNMIGVLLAVIVCLLLIWKLYKIPFKLSVDKEVVQQVQHYAAGNYVLSILSGLPGLILPLIITSRISAEQTAYFYMPNMIILLLTTIPATIARSYLSESAAIDAPAPIRKPILFSYALLTPIIVFTIFFGNLILTLFGKNYSAAGSLYLSLSSVSIFISVINYFLSMKLLIQHRLKLLIQINLAVTTSYLVLAWLLTSLGINGIAYASIISQIIFFGFLFYTNKND